jgi:hypothetical protein
MRSGGVEYFTERARDRFLYKSSGVQEMKIFQRMCRADGAENACP